MQQLRVWHKLPFKIIRKVAAIFDTVTNLHWHCRAATRNQPSGCCQRGVRQMQLRCQLKAPLYGFPLPTYTLNVECRMGALNIDLKNMQLWIVRCVQSVVWAKSNRNRATIPPASPQQPITNPQTLNQLPLVASLWPILNLI